MHTSNQFPKHSIIDDFMRLLGLGVILYLTVPPFSHATPRAQSLEENLAPQYAFVNGKLFTEDGFHGTTFYSVKGTFTRIKPSIVDKTIDLRGGFVVPPFGEAHTHNVEGP